MIPRGLNEVAQPLILWNKTLKTNAMNILWYHPVYKKINSLQLYRKFRNAYRYKTRSWHHSKDKATRRRLLILKSDETCYYIPHSWLICSPTPRTCACATLLIRNVQANIGGGGVGGWCQSGRVVYKNVDAIRVWRDCEGKQWGSGRGETSRLTSLQTLMSCGSFPPNKTPANLELGKTKMNRLRWGEEEWRASADLGVCVSRAW